MNSIIEKINCILALWNPIGVPQEIAKDEYKDYGSELFKYIENPDLLMNCLEDILINKLELEYDSTNEIHLQDLKDVRDNIIQVCKPK